MRRGSLWRRSFCPTASPALRTTAVPKLWRRPWKFTRRGTGIAYVVARPQRGQASGTSGAGRFSRHPQRQARQRCS
ncbi:MAG: hypothetical protein QM767_08300 [Anaeromyxobacter sp.]